LRDDGAPAASPERCCANCGTALTDRYCSHCGQPAWHGVPTLRQFGAELLEKLFGAEAKTPLTLKRLLFAPGAVTADFLAGRRQRYVSPLRLYFAISVVFFIGLTLVPGLRIGISRTGIDVNTEATAVAEVRAETGFAAIDDRVDRFMAQAPMMRDHALRGGMVRNAPRAMLLLVPLFAALLKLLYPRMRYGGHLLTALHFHSAAFLILLPGLVPWPQPWHNALNDGIDLVLAVYLYLTLRRIYAAGPVGTAVRTAAVLMLYTLALIGATVALVVYNLEH